MALVVHESFALGDRVVNRGEVLNGNDEALVAANIRLLSRCSRVNDSAFSSPEPPEPTARPSRRVSSVIAARQDTTE